MRYRIVENAPQGHGKKQAWIALNINELDLLSSMALQMLHNLPKTGPTSRVQQVSRHMHQEMQRAIAELEKSGIDERSKEKYPFDNRAVV